MALGLLGCGGSSSQQLYNYPDYVKAAFMSSCTHAAGHNGVSVSDATDACRCAIQRLEDSVPPSELAEIGQSDAPPEATAAAQDAISKCAP